jgi:outer membrane receptor protein involved in Fe transport
MSCRASNPISPAPRIHLVRLENMHHLRRWVGAVALFAASTAMADDATVGNSEEGFARRAEDERVRPGLPLPRIQEELVIRATSLDPRVDVRPAGVYRQSLFARDDQLLDTLQAGIDLGQHEGGGKSLEVRRFGFNLDHGGVSGGLRVVVNNVAQNQATQGHGQGYLGELKQVIPELIEDVEILNGPFSAQQGDFSGLGVVHVHYRESLPETLAVRAQAGNFGSRRGFIGWSPRLGPGAEAFVAAEATITDGPFQAPLRYRRHNFAANYSRRFGNDTRVGLRLTAGDNEFHSSGQIPLDEVEAGRLDRFAAADPDSGGSARSGTVALYYRRDLAGGGVFQVDAFGSRSRLDLFSNFTFFLQDPLRGDEIQQHDSRLQEGMDVRWTRPHRIFDREGVIAAGGNVGAGQIRVGLSPSVSRRAVGISTLAHVGLTNAAAYVQETVSLRPELVLEAGLRYDAFGFDVDDLVAPSQSGRETAGRLQPKISLALTPFRSSSLALHLNYGRGIASQDARGVVRSPSGPKLATTDFWQAGLATAAGPHVSVVADAFLIDRSAEQVYVPDDGSLELAGPSRAYGYEFKSVLRLGRAVSVSGSLTRVMNAFFRGRGPRAYVSGAPHTVANAVLVLEDWHGMSASLRCRHASGYRLDDTDATLRASGRGVADLSITRTLGSRMAVHLAVDNLTDARYYETQNLFESRLRPEDPAVSRIHGTPGYPRTITVGLTVRFGRHAN